MRDSDAMDGAAGRVAGTLDGLLRPTEVAEMLGVSRMWLYAAAKDGRGPVRPVGRSGWSSAFVERDLLAWLERARAGRVPGESSAGTAQRAAAAQLPRATRSYPKRGLPPGSRGAR